MMGDAEEREKEFSKEEKEDTRRWSLVEQNNARVQPGPNKRSLHAGAVCGKKLYIFGGYDGNNRVNDLHTFDFSEKMWNLVSQRGDVPSARDRHCMSFLHNSLYLFGGFNGTMRTNDFYVFHIETNTWVCLSQSFGQQPNIQWHPQAPQRNNSGSIGVRMGNTNGTAADNSVGAVGAVGLGQPQMQTQIQMPNPSPRHSASLLGCETTNSLFLFGGFDGEYKNDLWEYKNSNWIRILAKGKVPRARYRMSCCLYQDNLIYVFGGHDGTRHLNDLFCFDISTSTWIQIQQNGPMPLPRDSHTGVIYGNSLYIFGGSSGSALNDFHELNLITNTWSAVLTDGMVPTMRFCHVGIVYDHSFYIFGGYDGVRRLNDFQCFWFGYGSKQKKIPPASLTNDLIDRIDMPVFSDVVFTIEGKNVHAHRMLCARCPYFNYLFDVEKGREPEIDSFNVKEFGSKTNQSPFVIENVSYQLFMNLLRYLYSDRDKFGILPTVKESIKLYQLAVLYRVKRLQSICLTILASSISVDNVTWMLRAADKSDLPDLRKICLFFVKENFDIVSTSKGFEEVGRENVELVFEILRERSSTEADLSRKRTNSARSRSQSEAPDNFDSLTSDISDVQVCNLPRWKRVMNEDTYANGKPLSLRSLHASAIYKNYLYIFGGYDGKSRVQPFDRFDLKKKEWTVIKNYTPPNMIPQGDNTGLDLRQPVPRDRHTLTAVGTSLYLFGGYYRNSMTNELFRFDLESNRWSLIPTTMGTPTPRHSHSASALRDSVWIFGGYDGSYMNDLHEYNTLDQCWERVPVTGAVPQERYRATMVAYGNRLYVFGGHDGMHHLSDVCMFDIDLKIWTLVPTSGKQPIPRDSHAAAVCGQVMYVFGGSSGSALNDFLALDLETHTWSQIQTEGMVPAARFCHVAEVYNCSLYIFGGYNGAKRLNDFNYVELNNGIRVDEVPASRLVPDLLEYVNNPCYADVEFIIEDEIIHAHKIICQRAPYFHAMFSGSNFVESRQSRVDIKDIQISPFLDLLRYLYSDEFHGNPLELFELADRFGVDRLKAICESEMFSIINVETAAPVLYTANIHNAMELRNAALKFILDNFDTVSKTDAFENVARVDVELIIEILRLR